MKSLTRNTPIVLLFIILMTGLLTGCNDDDCERLVTYTYYEPVYIETEAMRASFGFREPEAVNFPGKIYLLGDYLFVNEVGEGIHVFDNADPANPVNTGFINIPGNHDIAASGNILYADSYVDLVVIDISDMDQVKEVNRIENVFNDHYYVEYYGPSESDAILVRFDEVDTSFVDQSECDEVFPTWLRGGGMGPVPIGGLAMEDAVNFFPSNNPSSGIGGSMARFTIVEDRLYTVGMYALRVFDISEISNPVSGVQVELGWGIETVFPYEENLFIGAQNGMHIYDISNPDNPYFISTFAHVTSCDPVVVRDTIAFVTLRSGTECEGFTNQLDVIDISNLHTPRLLKSYPMQNPHGLGVDEEALFICEGDFGLKVFNSADVYSIDQHLLRHYADIHAYDVIPFNDVLIMIGEDGLYQYDYSELDQIELLSHIPVYAGEAIR